MRLPVIHEAVFAAAVAFAALLMPTCAGAAPPVASADGSVPSLVQTLAADDGEAYDAFGHALAVSGDTLVVGAFNAGTVRHDGAVYVYTRSGSGWSHQAKLAENEWAYSDGFGWSVAISGDTLVVGAPENSGPSTGGPGAVYVYTRSGSTWSRQAKLTAADGMLLDYLGYSVAVSGDTIVAGAPNADHAETIDAGAAYVFVRTGTEWSQQAKLVASDGAHIGSAVAISDETILVGAHDSVDAAYVYLRTGTDWFEQAKLTATDDGARGLGCSVAISGETAVVGAKSADVPGTDEAGAAYVFERTGAIWSQDAKLYAEDSLAGDGFGTSVAIREDAVLVGAPGATITHPGSAYSFLRSGSVWGEATRLAAWTGTTGGATPGWFGWSVAIADTELLTGAPYLSTAGGAAPTGTVFAFAPYHTPEDSALSAPAPGVLANDTDTDGDPLIAEILARPSHGVVWLSATGSFLYIPEDDWYGTDTFTYRAYDGVAYSAPAVVTITVTPIDDVLAHIGDQAAGVTFDRWVTGFSGSYSGGTYVYGRWTNTELQARFTGDTIRWIGPKQPSYGMADVYIDGVKKATVDCYAPPGSATLSTTLWESTALSDGPHTIQIRLTGAKNAASTGNVVVVDRFQVQGTSPSGAGTRLNEQGVHATFTGMWIKAVNPTYTSSTYAYSSWAGPVYQATFTGTRVAWIGPKVNNYGKANVYIDGALKGTIDCYSSATGWRYKIWESAVLSSGAHTIQIRPTRTKNAASTNYVVVVDALDATP